MRATVAKLTPKQENFALAYVETGNASEAYRRAYDAENMSKDSIKVEACKLLAHPNVTLTVVTMQEAAQERTLVTVESITKELEEARLMADEEKQPSAMTAASMGKAKVNGLLVDKVEKKVDHKHDYDGAAKALLAVLTARDARK